MGSNVHLAIILMDRMQYIFYKSESFCEFADKRQIILAFRLQKRLFS